MTQAGRSLGVRLSGQTTTRRQVKQWSIVYKRLDSLIEWLQGVWPKIIPVALEMPIFYVNFSSLNYPNLKDESLGPNG